MKALKKLGLMVMALCFIVAMTACGQHKTNEESTKASEADSASTSESAKEGVANKEGKKPVLLTVSFGTSYNDSRDVTIGAIEKALAKAYPEYDVRRAFTSQIIIDKLKKRDKIEIDNVKEAMERMVKDGVKDVVIQPTHIMEGFEYDDVVTEVKEYADKFDTIRFGKNLLSEDKDYDRLIEVLEKETEQYKKEGMARVFMGHGTAHQSNDTYAKLQKKIDEKGIKDIFVGTVEATPTCADVIELAKKGGFKKAALMPLMIVAGDHANNDMAGDDDDSWKSQFTKAGFATECVIKGLGQYEGIQQMIVDHAKETMAQPAEDFKKEAAASKPMEAKDLKEGTYPIQVKSSSSMFKVVDCQLTVKDGKMSALMTMSGKGYGKLFLGKGEEAEKASEDQFIPAQKEGDQVKFTVPVEKLNVPMDCAAWSNRKEKWYDRKITFQYNTAEGADKEQTSSSEPKDSQPAGAVEGAATTLKDGEYQLPVKLEGGSGRATVTSPAKVAVKDGKALATIQWSSKHYIYMLVNGKKYEPINKEGNSVFEIPAEIDKDMKVVGCTDAMSKPYEVDYTLHFDGNAAK